MPTAWPISTQRALALRIAARGAPGLPGGPPSRRWRVSSPYGLRTNPFSGLPKFHHGIDFAIPVGTPIRAMLGGTVRRIDVEDVGERGRLHGNAVVVDSPGGWSTIYMHLAGPVVRVGDEVAPGQLIGLSGASGRVTGPHLHFSVFYRGKSLDPAMLFPPGSL